MKRVLAALSVLACVGYARAADADQPRALPRGYHVRAETLLNATPSLALLSVGAETPRQDWWSVETLMWSATGDSLALRSQDEPLKLDVLVLNLRLRDPARIGELHLGRFFVSAGALRPVHIDGAWAKVRLPYRFSLEAFGGVPVTAAFGAAEYDWTAGTRMSLDLSTSARVGLAYAQRRERGSLADHEVGIDAIVLGGDVLDAHGKLAVDLIQYGISDASVSLIHHDEGWSLGVFGSHASAARLLSATSLFSVLGDAESTRVGALAEWRAFPRLALDATMAARGVQARWGPSAKIGAELMFDDDDRSSARIEGFRDFSGNVGWTGARLFLRLAMIRDVELHATGELSIRDRDSGRGRLWPYGSASAVWRPVRAWSLAGGVEASASPEYLSAVTGLVRVRYDWEHAP